MIINRSYAEILKLSALILLFTFCAKELIDALDWEGVLVQCHNFTVSDRDSRLYDPEICLLNDFRQGTHIYIYHLWYEGESVYCDEGCFE